MSQLLLITKFDFPEFWPLSTNIGDHLVNPYVGKAQTFDVRPLFTTAEWEGFTRNLGADAGEFPGIEVNEAEFLTSPPATGWDNPTLAALWAGFVRPLLVTESFRRFMRWHGTHITENGLETFSDGGNQPISPARRAELKADVEAERELYRNRLATALRVYRGSVPSASCAPKPKRQPGKGGPTFHAI
ncbi:hypothetical protein K3G63_10920 [Hymenobacter sp. HSC-4F20]|uniref:DUF6712 family protein n=1 Tax=Hymenobacter sp. HSC-4F20 TaxID=2864135 RepID=UPI001C734D2F|nr:hypothetical protein [Hymenobacter sp. HSC-4F20]MBX0290954.1 hypothetical protein [Hymenobacter sp. HSC-4F20]